MALLPILTVGDPALRERAREVSPEELASAGVQSFVDDLVETMRHASGAGLAATQVGRPLRICAIEVTAGNPRYPYKPPIPLTVLVNPVLTRLGDESFDSYEGCLSVPGLRGQVSRWAGVRVQALDRDGKPVDREVWGLSAGTYQHEVDHLDGTLFLDRVTDTRTLCTWESFDRFHREAFVERARRLVERFGS